MFANTAGATTKKGKLMQYQVTMTKTQTLSVFIESNSAESAAEKGRQLMMDDDESAFIEHSSYSPAEVYEIERTR